MYEAFFEMEHTPFTRDIPPGLLYESPYVADAIGRLTYAADRQLQNQIEIIRGVQNKKVICILDEARLLEKETVEDYSPD